MPKVSPRKTNFAGGEFSPLVHGRSDNERYESGVAEMLNYVPVPQGPVIRRPGTKFINTTINAFSGTAQQVGLVPFVFGSGQSFMIEIRAGAAADAIRIYDDSGDLIHSFSSPGIAGFEKLRWAQSADVIFFTHPVYPPFQIARFGDTDWRLTVQPLVNGPYQPINSKPYTLTPSAATGSATVTAGPSVNVAGVVVVSGFIEIETASDHIYVGGDRVFIEGVTGAVEANGTYRVREVTAADKFTIEKAGPITPYVSGGSVKPGIFYSTDAGAGALWTAADNQRLLRVRQSNVWGWGKITAFTNASVVTVQIVDTFTSTAAKSVWQLGAFGMPNSETGISYPTAITIHELRVFYGGVGNQPQSIYASRTDDFYNFSPSDPDGTVTASHGLNFTLDSNDVNRALWFNSDDKGLVVGTTAGEWLVRGAGANEAITPTSISARRQSSFGSADIPGVRVGKAVLYWQPTARRLREFLYYDSSDGFRSNDLTLIANHIAGPGVKRMVYQREPFSIVWCLRTDGVLIGMSYERDMDAISVGWHRHDVSGTVVDIAMLPMNDNNEHSLWMLVIRNGATCVERMPPIFEVGLERKFTFDGSTYTELSDGKDARFLDSHITVDTIFYGAANTATPGVITCQDTAGNPVVHGLTTGDKIRIYDSQSVGVPLTTGSYFVDVIDTTTFNIRNVNTNALVDFSGFGLSVVFWRKFTTSVSGLTHLDGLDVGILADGAPQPVETVSSGAITLDTPGALVHVGVPFTSRCKLLRIDMGSADGTSMGKTKRIQRVAVMLKESLGLKLGFEGRLDPVIFRTTSDPLSNAPGLFTGIITQTVDGDYDLDNQIVFEQDQPLPSTVLGVFPQMNTYDRG